MQSKQHELKQQAEQIFGADVFLQSLSVSPQQVDARVVSKMARAFYFLRHDSTGQQQYMEKQKSRNLAFLCRWFWDEGFGRQAAG